MKNEFVEKKALESAIDHLKNYNTPIADLKKFAAAVLLLCDKFGGHIPNEEIVKLAENFPNFTGQLLQSIKSESAERETALTSELRKRIAS